jgi:hypothetical protein
VSIVKSTTEPGLFYVRVLEDGKQPFEGIEGLLVALGAEDTLRPWVTPGRALGVDVPASERGRLGGPR